MTTTKVFPILLGATNFDLQKIKEIFQEVLTILSGEAPLLTEEIKQLLKKAEINIDLSPDHPEGNFIRYQINSDNDKLIALICYIAGIANSELIKHQY